MANKVNQTIDVFNLISRYNSENVKNELKSFFNDLKYTTRFKAKP